MHGYLERPELEEYAKQNKIKADLYGEDFAPLEAVASVLVLDKDIIATSYRTADLEAVVSLFNSKQSVKPKPTSVNDIPIPECNSGMPPIGDVEDARFQGNSDMQGEVGDEDLVIPVDIKGTSPMKLDIATAPNASLDPSDPSDPSDDISLTEIDLAKGQAVWQDIKKSIGSYYTS